MRKIERITLCSFFGFLLLFAVLFWVFPHRSVSEQENRTLQELPKLSGESLTSGEFSSAVNDYYADQFPLRDAFVGIKGISELLLFKGENNGVLLGRGGRLAKRLLNLRTSDGSILKSTDGYDAEALSKATKAISDLADSLSVPLTVAFPGRNGTVESSAFSYPTKESERLHAQLREELSTADYIDLSAILKEKFEEGKEVYYKTDHHWTTQGAYYAYRAILSSFGMESEISEESAFERRTVSEEFYGTLWSAGGMKFVYPDRMEYWLTGHEEEYTVTADGVALKGFYEESYLETKDKYGSFLDGTHDVVTVTKPGEDRPLLLIFKDSFANSLAPFLAAHFDLVLLNLSSLKTDFTSVTQQVEKYHPNRVLILYSEENLLTTKTAWKFK